jgi:hypothetical protein
MFLEIGGVDHVESTTLVQTLAAGVDQIRGYGSRPDTRGVQVRKGEERGRAYM